MIRAVLSLLLCGATLGVGLRAAYVQATNHARAGRLDRVVRETERRVRECGHLRERIERIESAERALWNAPRTMTPEGGRSE